ncbi:MAG: prepilin-type N-terminal cleavage/methylation domain-containing protein [Syntrophobacteraceae bacterium]
MFIRMKENKGFTLVELMIVVAIIGILAAVAVPYYQKYIQKSRLTSLVWPGVHIIQTNIGTYFNLNNAFPTAGTAFNQLIGEADSTYFSVALTGDNGTAITFILSKEGNPTSPLHALSGEDLVATVLADDAGLITGWSYSGRIAADLGLSGVQ